MLSGWRAARTWPCRTIILIIKSRARYHIVTIATEFLLGSSRTVREVRIWNESATPAWVITSHADCDASIELHVAAYDVHQPQFIQFAIRSWLPKCPLCSSLDHRPNRETFDWQNEWINKNFRQINGKNCQKMGLELLWLLNEHWRTN